MASKVTRRYRTVAAIAVTMFTMTACTGASDPTTPIAEGTDEQTSDATVTPDGSDDDSHVVVGVPVSMRTMNPLMESSALHIQRSIFDSLTTMSPEGEIQPHLATDWEANDDATVWTFTVRTDVTFHDGTPLTVEDIIFSFQEILDTEESSIRGNLTPIESMEKIGEDQLRFNLNRSFAPWPNTLSRIFIVPEDSYSQETFHNAPIGSGPYSLTSWSDGEPAELEAYSDYWGEAPDFERVTAVSASDPGSRLTALQSSGEGAFDLTNLTVSQLPAVEGTEEITTESGPSNRVVYIGYNVTTEPLDDPQLRRAISLAINREELVNTLIDGHGEPVGQMLAPVTFGHDPSIEPVEFDPDEARSLVEQSSYDGETIVMEYPSEGEVPAVNELAQAIQGYLEAVGVTIELQGATDAAFIPALQAKELQGMFLFNWRPSSLDAAQVLNLSFRHDVWAYFDDPELEAAIDEADAAADPEERLQHLSDVWEIDRENTYFTYLFYDEYHYGMKSDEVSYQPRADGLLHPHQMRMP